MDPLKQSDGFTASLRNCVPDIKKITRATIIETLHELTAIVNERLFV